MSIKGGTWRDGPPEHNGTSLDITDIRFLTVREIAVKMRVSNMTVYRLVHSGELAGAIRVGRSFRVPEQTVNRYLMAAVITQDGT